MEWGEVVTAPRLCQDGEWVTGDISTYQTQLKRKQKHNNNKNQGWINNK